MLLRYLYKFVIDELGVQPKQFQIHPSSICEITATKKRWKSGHYFEVIVPIYTYVNFYTSHRVYDIDDLHTKIFHLLQIR